LSVLLIVFITILHNYTLFPYTTLFRSSLRMRFLHTALILVLVSSFGFAAFGFAADAAPALLAAGRVDDAISTLQQEVSASPNDADRKSTRLNSSHVAISYAVFCLKKKT